MGSDSNELSEAERRLEEARRDLELRLGELRGSVESELGFVPRHKYLLVGLLAGAGGLAVACAAPATRISASRPGAAERDSD